MATLGHRQTYSAQHIDLEMILLKSKLSYSNDNQVHCIKNVSFSDSVVKPGYT